MSRQGCIQFVAGELEWYIKINKSQLMAQRYVAGAEKWKREVLSD
jgi:hypothetical protein